MIDNALQLLAVSAGFFLLLIVCPYFVYGMYKREGETFPKVLFTFCCSSAQTILSIYLMSFLNVFTQLMTYALFITEYLFIYVFVRRKTIIKTITDAYQFVLLLNKGYYKTRVELRKLRRGLFAQIGIAWGKCFHRKGFWAFCVIVAFAAGMAIRMAPVILNKPFGGNDLYVHTQWTKALMDGDVFFRGVYPLGMHCISVAIALLFRINIVTLIRMVEIPFAFMMMAGVFFTIYALFSNRWAALTAIAIYGCYFTVTFEAYWRQSIAFPQETSMVYWVIASGIFVRLLRYEKADRIEKRYFYCFCFALLCVVLVHPFSLMPAGIFCAIFFALFIRKILADRARLLRRLVVGVALAFAVGVVPLVTGVALGKPLDSSFAWGLESIQGVPALVGDEEAEQVVDRTPIFQRIRNYFVNFYQSARSNDIGYAYSHTVKDTVGYSYAKTFYANLITMPMSLILLIMRKTRTSGVLMLGYTLYNFIMFAFLNGVQSGLPKLMTFDRAEQFYAVFECGLYAIPVKMLASIGARAQKAITAFGSAAVLIFMYQLVGFKYVQPFATGNSIRAQWNGAVQAYYDIVDEYPKGQWTIVSPVDEVALTMQEGYHYELVDFIKAMEYYDESMVIHIPTDYVFFYVEKYPLNQEDYYNIESSYVPLDPEEAFEPFPELGSVGLASEVYQDYLTRRILEAKINLWCEVYARHFPDDMSVFYEDNELKVYCFKQNMFKYSNLAIDYGGNSYDGRNDAPK
jgi:hypothetical protein